MTQILSTSQAGAIASPTLDLVAPLSARTLFWRPRYLQSSAILHHVPFLFWLTDLLRPSNFLGLGIGDGAGYFAICQAVDKLNLDARCHGIGGGAEATPDAAIPETVDRYNDTNYGDFSRFLTGDPAGLTRRFADKGIDLMLVDTDISDTLLSTLRHDWVRKLSDRGVVVLHGLHDRFTSEAAREFLNTVRRSYPTVTLDAGEGMLVVLHGASRQDQLMQLADLAPGDTGYGDVHRVFSHLGKSTFREWENRAALDRARQAETALEETRRALDTAEQSASDLRDRLRALEGSAQGIPGRAAADPGLGELADRLTRMQTQMEETRAQTVTRQAALEADLTAAQAALGERDHTIAALQTRLNDQDTALRQAETDVTTQAGRFDDLVHKKDEVWEKVAQRDRTIAGLKSDMADTGTRLKNAAAELEKLRGVLKTTADERSSLAVKTAKLEAMLASNDARQIQGSQEREALTLKVARLEAALSSQTAKQAEIVSARDVLQKNCAELEAALSERGSTDSEIAALTETRERERETLTRELEKSADRLKTVINDLGLRKARVAELEARETARFREVEMLTRAIETNRLPLGEMDEMRRRATEAEQRIADMMASRSWRITAPARRFLGTGRTGKT